MQILRIKCQFTKQVGVGQDRKPDFVFSKTWCTQLLTGVLLLATLTLLFPCWCGWMYSVCVLTCIPLDRSMHPAKTPLLD